MPLKVAIVGCGKIADGHVEQIQKMPEKARVVAVCDLEALMAEQLAVRYALPAFYDDLDRLLARERPDVVHITTPPGSHLAVAQKAIDAGAHVYVEKPLTPSFADARRLVDHARAAGKLCTIGYSYLLDPPALAMRDLIRRGVLGDVVHVESFYGYSLRGPFGAAIMADAGHWVHRLPGKLVHNNLDHVLNKLPELMPDDRPDADFDARPLGDLRVMASGWARREERYGDARDDLVDELRVTIVGGRVSAYGTFSSHIQPTGHFTRVYGTKTTIDVDYAKRTVTVDAPTRLPSAMGRLAPAFAQAGELLREGAKNLVRFAQSDFHYFAGLHRLFALFYERIEAGGPPPIPYRDILWIAALMDEIFRQVPQQGRPS